MSDKLKRWAKRLRNNTSKQVEQERDKLEHKVAELRDRLQHLGQVRERKVRLEEEVRALCAEEIDLQQRVAEKEKEAQEKYRQEAEQALIQVEELVAQYQAQADQQTVNTASWFIAALIAHGPRPEELTYSQLSEVIQKGVQKVEEFREKIGSRLVAVSAEVAGSSALMQEVEQLEQATREMEEKVEKACENLSSQHGVEKGVLDVLTTLSLVDARRISEDLYEPYIVDANQEKQWKLKGDVFQSIKGGQT